MTTVATYGPNITKELAARLGIDSRDKIQPVRGNSPELIRDADKPVIKKGNSDMSSAYDSVKDILGGDDKKDKPKKELKEVRVRKGHGGKGHIIEHHHTQPEHHPMEEHVTGTDDEMAEHVMANMGNGDAAQATPNASATPAMPQPTM